MIESSVQVGYTGTVGGQAQSPAPWTLAGAEKRSAIKRMFADIAPHYDRLNGIMSLSLHHRWRKAAISAIGISEGDAVLDVCCGTGDFLSAINPIVGPSGRSVGVDFALPMLQIASRKGIGGLMLGDGCRLPFADEVFNAVTVGWGLRNVEDIDSAITEIHRCLKPGGRLATLDMAIPRNALIRAGSRFVGRYLLPILGRVVGNRSAYEYLPNSAARFDSPEQLADRLRRLGFSDVRFRRFMFGNIGLVWGTKV